MLRYVDVRPGRLTADLERRIQAIETSTKCHWRRLGVAYWPTSDYIWQHFSVLAEHQ